MKSEQTTGGTLLFPVREHTPHVLFIFLVTLIVFGRGVSNGFLNFDDNVYFTENTIIRDLSWEGIKAVFSTFVSAHYHPLTVLSFAFDYHVWGSGNPIPLHAENILLHAINSLLLYVLAFQLTRKKNVAVLAALLFAIHPLRVESVVWIAERKDVLFSSFYLGALVQYFRWSLKGRNGFPVWTFVLFTLSLLAKATAVSLPVMLLLLDLYSKRTDRKRLIGEKIPFLLMSLAFGFTAMTAQSNTIANSPPAYERVFLISYALLFYIMKFFVPIHQSAIIPFPSTSSGFLPIEFYLAPFVLIGLAIAVYMLVKKYEWLGFAAIAFLIPIAPLLVQFPSGPAYLAERYTYLPHAVIAIVVSVGLFNSFSGKLPYLFGSLALLVLGVLTWERIMVWESSTTLMDNVILRQPRVPVAYYNRALARAESGNSAGAEADFEKAVELQPDYTDAWLNLGMSYSRSHQYARAIPVLRKAVELNPHHVGAWTNLGSAYGATGLLDSAIIAQERAIFLDHSNPVIRYNVALTYYYAHDEKRSAASLKEAVRLNPSYTQAWFLLGGVLNDLGERDASISSWKTAARLGSPEARQILSKQGVSW